MKVSLTAFAAGLLLTSAVLAHSGVKDPAVRARMASMGILGAETKVLGEMAKGVAPFDAARAKAAIDAMRKEARTTPALFEARANDPKSEALPDIWTNWTTFTAGAAALETALAGADVTSPETLRRSLGKIGDACRSCHKTFRQ